MSKKYYAVRVGRKPGIYHTWSEAQAQVHGFPNAVYQSFKSFTEAENFMIGNKNSTPKKQTTASADSKQPTVPDSDPNTISAYVDGSFDKNTKRYSFGIVMIQNNEVIEKLSRVGNNPKYQDSWQIAGEVFGALHAVKWAIDHHFKKIIVHYDYAGIEHWALGDWKTNKPVSIDYAEAFQKLIDKIEVEFVKVKAHSGVKYNELVDQLAKNALKNSTQK